MSRFYTVMVIPEKEKGVKSFKIPKIFFNSLIFLGFIIVVVLAILSYDYVKILKQVYENRHLSIENRQLKEQIQLFNMKLNTLTDDIERVQQFEKKLRVITGFDKDKQTKPLLKGENIKIDPEGKLDHSKKNNSDSYNSILNDSEIKKLRESQESLQLNNEYQDIKDLYERKIATNFGLITGYSYTKEWNSLIKQSFKLAESFAEFDYKFSILRNLSSRLEFKINQLDQNLLNRSSFLRSTPSLLPAKGWITSYYGPRMSHYSNRVKMHEGLDVGAPIGTPIISPADGIVKIAGKNPGFGYYVEIDHGYGVETLYAHNSRNYVKKGQRVERGDLIAKVGNTGMSTGPHLHYEIRVNGTPVDPLYYILD